MDLTQTTITLSSIIAIVGVILAVLTFIGNRAKNSKDDEARLVRMEAMLVNVEKNTSNLYTKVENHDKLLTKHDGEIKVLQEKVKAKGK